MNTLQTYKATNRLIGRSSPLAGQRRGPQDDARLGPAERAEETVNDALIREFLALHSPEGRIEEELARWLSESQGQ